MSKLLQKLVCLVGFIAVAHNAISQCGTFPPSGLVTVSSPNTVVNGYFPGEANSLAGSSTMTLGQVDSRGAAVNLAAGDLLLIIQMQGADINSADDNTYGSGAAANGKGYLTNTNLVAGRYEYNVVQSVVNLGLATIITFQYPLVNSYYNRAFSLGTSQTFQAVWMPKYHDLTINNGASVTSPTWNGSTGGVVAITASNLITNNGLIDVAGKGFRGGGGKQFSGTSAIAPNTFRHNSPLVLLGNNSSGSKGEGIAGTPIYTHTTGAIVSVSGILEGYLDGSMGRGAPANAGGGGSDGRPASNEFNTGGGGGGNGGTGGMGGSGWHGGSGNQYTYPYGGMMGSSFAEASISRFIMGGGGGAGTANNSNAGNEYQSSGGSGGGIIVTYARMYAGTGIMNANGGDAPGILGSGGNTDAAGGGGGGGTIVAVISNSNNNSGLSGQTLMAHGGRGGDVQTYYDHGPGGGGGGGVIITQNDIAATDIVGGSNGYTRTGNTSGPLDNAYGSTPGNPGTVQLVNRGVTIVNPTVLSPCGVLPVLLTSFTATTSNNDVLLFWEVEQAISFSHFEVEYSVDGITFKQFQAVVYSATTKQYEAVHQNAPAGTKYYRLKMVDRSGSYSYSKIITIRPTDSKNKTQLSLAPQPATNYVQFTVSADRSQSGDISIFDMQGKKVIQSNTRLQAGTNYVNLSDLQKLTPGLYLIQVQVDGKTLSEKMIIAKK